MTRFRFVWLPVSLMLLSLSLPAPGRAEDVAGGKTSFVHLFEWKWSDVAAECEQFLGPAGYNAVQVSPPNEHAVLPGYPWYQRYQPVSYKLESRSGTRAEFASMVRRCAASGVRVYVDAVINHMTWENRSGGLLYGSAGTPYGHYDYPGTYAPWDFHHCGRNGDSSIQNYQDRWEVQNCNLATLVDLRTETSYVRDKIAEYLNDLLDLGVAGFRIDAAKHIPAEDMQAILSRLRRPYYPLQEVIDFGGEPISGYEYFGAGDVTEFRYARKIAEVFTGGKLSWTREFGQAWGFYPSAKAVVFTDNHDIQRGHGAGGLTLTYHNGRRYVLANAFMLAWPFGYTQVMSSFDFSDPQAGPPANERGQTLPVYRGTRARSGGAETRCGAEWICEHRWPAIAAMVRFRNATNGAPVERWWTNGDNRVAFARGKRGYFAINAEPWALKQWFDTGLPAGQYCDVLADTGFDAKAPSVAPDPRKLRGEAGCSRVVTVDAHGWTELEIPAMAAVALLPITR